MSDDRDWQHPAEHAATNSHGFIMNPPPLAKRLVVLTALISALTSVAVLFVAIPKGIDEYVDAPEITTTVPPVKGATQSMLGELSIAGASTCAVKVHEDLWVAAAEPLGAASVATIDSPTLPPTRVQLFRSSDIPYLVVASSNLTNSSKGIPFTAEEVDEALLAKSRVVDCVNVQPMSIHETPKQFVDDSELPVFVNGEIHGLAIIFDRDNLVVGIVCEHDHSQWLLKPSVISQLVRSAR